MPYYKETFKNRVASTSSRSIVGGVTSYSLDSLTALDSVEMTSFRTRPHPFALLPTEANQMSTDPYAYFLDSTSERKYQARLKERGLQPEGDLDRGHSLELKRHITTGKLHDVSYTSVGLSPVVEGHFNGALVYPNPGNWLDGIHDGRVLVPASYKESGLDAYAQQAYSKVAPTSVVFDAATFLGELREGLPKLIPNLIKNQTKILKNAGSDYLNVEFGWKPLINDLQNAAKALMGATDLLTQQGKRVHRKHSLPWQSTSESYSGNRSIMVMSQAHRGFVAPGIFPEGSNQITTVGYGDVNLLKTRSSRRWFEGEFSFFYPLDFDPNDYFQRLNALVNTKITPETLWQLAPWSWLVDWNLRIGDSIRSNQLAANDLLVMHYGYAMEHSVYTTELSWRATSGVDEKNYKWNNFPSKGRYFSSTSYKRRLRANPYGFKTGGPSSLSGGQLAILGALGLTKT